MRQFLQNLTFITICVSTKGNKAVGWLCKLQNNIPRFPSISIYESFIWPHLYYGDILYHKMLNVFFHERLWSIQCYAALSGVGVIRGSSRKKALSRTRVRIPTTTAVVQKTLFLSIDKKKQVPIF